MAFARRLIDKLRARPAPIERPLLEHDAILALAQRLARAQRGVPAHRDVAHRAPGEVRSARRGGGLDYDDSRPYQPGDDPRAMDWRLTARSGEPFVKRYREERRPSTFILVDRRGPMRFGTRVRLKATQAARVAALAAFAAEARREAIAGVLVERNPRWLAEAAGPEAAVRFATAAAAPAPPEAADGEPALAAILGHAAQALVPGTELWLISDFHDLDAGCRPLLWQLAAEHRVRAVRVVDPAERTLPPAGAVQLAASRGAAPVRVDTRAVAEHFSRAAADHLCAQRDLFAALDISYVQLPSELDAIERELPL